MEYHSCLSEQNGKKIQVYDYLEEWLSDEGKLKSFKVNYTRHYENPLIVYERGLIEILLQCKEKQELYDNLEKHFQPDHKIQIVYSLKGKGAVIIPKARFALYL